MKKGQVLLVLVMVFATVLTVTLTATYQSITDTQLTKLEEENQKALAAAEAGIEAALNKKQTVNIGSLPNLSSFAGQAEIKANQSNQFITHIVQKDEQYTFYLSPYNPETKSFSGGSIQQDIDICFGYSNFNPAIEITLIKNNYTVKKYAVNPKNINIIQNAESASSPTNCPQNNPSFTNKYSILSSDIGTNSQLLIVRVINTQAGATKIGFKSNNDFPLQGSTIISTARSSIGVEKKVQLFQSYPQIPSEFFVTSF